MITQMLLKNMISLIVKKKKIPQDELYCVRCPQRDQITSGGIYSLIIVSKPHIYPETTAGGRVDFKTRG